MFAFSAVIQWRQKGCVKVDKKFSIDMSGFQKNLAAINEDGAWVCADIQDMQDRDAEVFGSLINSKRCSNENLDALAKNSEYLKELAELRRIADAAEAQAKIAKEEADRAKKESEEAKKDAKFSKCISIVSIGITIFFSAAQIIVQLIQ